MSVVNDNVIRLYQVRPEMALEHLKRTTGLNFDEVPQSLATLANTEEQKLYSKGGSKSDLIGYNEQNENSAWAYDDSSIAPPILSDIIAEPVFKKNR